MKVDKENYITTEVKYSRMDKYGHLIGLLRNTYEDAVEDAKFDQPANGPYKIIKVTSIYEVVGEVD